MSGFNSGFTSSSEEDDEDFVPGSGAKKRPDLSLKARAVSLLSRREYSRAELLRKLSPHADTPEVLEALLDDLAKEGWQSDDRVIQSVVHRKSPLHGSLRIAQELKQKGMNDQQVAEIRDQLKNSEFERAQLVWTKKFGASSISMTRSSDPSASTNHSASTQTPAEYARQARFLAARGFSHDIVRRVLKASVQTEHQDILDPDDL